jgi:hypothetical protein
LLLCTGPSLSFTHNNANSLFGSHSLAQSRKLAFLRYKSFPLLLCFIIIVRFPS